jgi:hypothetical protein
MRPTPPVQEINRIGEWSIFFINCIKKDLSWKFIFAQPVTKFPEYFVSEFNYCVQKSPTLDPKLSQFDLVQTYFLKDHFHYYFSIYSKDFFLQIYRLYFSKQFSSPILSSSFPV